METNYNPSLVAFYDIWPGNGVGLFSTEKIKEKKIKKENISKLQVSYKKQKEASDKVNKHTNNLYSAAIYNVSRAH